MDYYRGKFREARKTWLDLAEAEARRRGLEFQRDSKEEAFYIPGERAVRVRASEEQRPIVKLIVDDEMRAIAGDYGDLGDRIVLVILLLTDAEGFDPDQDDFVPVRDSILKRGNHTTQRADGKTQLTIDVRTIPFSNLINGWKWVFGR